MTVSPRLNEERLRRDVVTVGGSAGGIRAFRALLTHLPKDYRGTIAAVIHRSRFFESGRLAAVLSRGTPHSVVEPKDDEVIRSKRIYLAPRDRHMLVERRAHSTEPRSQGALHETGDRSALSNPPHGATALASLASCSAAAVTTVWTD